jgi:hypothetical protein
MGINTPKGTSMDYKNFTPTYSHLHVHKMTLDGDEYWTPKVLQTHLKIKKLHGVMYDKTAQQSIESPENYELLDKVIDLKFKVGMWVIERTHNPLNKQRRRNLITNSAWEQIYEHFNVFEGIPYELWLYEGTMIVLPSKETIEWLNELAYLFRVSNKKTV